ncbi:hypothetical protein ACHAW6_013603 [Cyclotella cf. meneghiniana]
MRRPSINYFVVLLSGFVTWYCISFIDPFVFIDSFQTSVKTPSTHDPQTRSRSDEATYETYTTLQNTNYIDNRIERRAIEIASYYAHHTDAFNQRCEKILIYMPDAFAFHGHASQINTYLMAVLLATYLNRPLLLLEPSGEWNTYEGGSQFGCPPDMFSENNQEQIDEFPNGFSRLIHHPVWLHNGCRIPDSHQYNVWNQMSGNFNPNGMLSHDSVSGRDVNVIVTRGSPLRGYFRQISNEMVSASDPDASLRWAVNLGASQEEAARFVQIKRPGEKWDYALGLSVKSGILRLQPWIARDVQNFLRDVNSHLDMFDGIHVRRGDKLLSESRGSVVHYWTSRGFAESNMPLDYIPFEHYLKRWMSDECPVNEKGEIEMMKHNVYVATDDPVVVKQEIATLMAVAHTAATAAVNNHDKNQHHDAQLQQTSQTHPALLFNGCHQLTFFFNPTQETSFHIAGTGERTPIEGDTCQARYNRNIASIADLWMLARSRTFIGEFNSNWGRLLRVVRLRLTDVDPFSVVLDMRIAWGRDDVGRPGGGQTNSLCCSCLVCSHNDFNELKVWLVQLNEIRAFLSSFTCDDRNSLNKTPACKQTQIQLARATALISKLSSHQSPSGTRDLWRTTSGKKSGSPECKKARRM